MDIGSTGMRSKLGLFNEEQQDATLVKDLLKIMKDNQADYTNTFRALTIDDLDALPMCKTPEFNEWHDRWKARLERQPESAAAAKQLMRQSNPSIIPRNHRVEEALEAAVDGDFSVLENLLDVLENPYAYTAEQEKYVAPSVSATPYKTFCGT